MEGEGFSGTVMNPVLSSKKSGKSFILKIKMAKAEPKKPKGKTSAYAYFVQTCREEQKKENPHVSVNFIEFSKKCSEKWKTMLPEEKTRFNEMAKMDKERYDREIKAYLPANKGNQKDPSAPKKPPSGFILFCAKYRPEIKSANPSISIGAMAKKLGEMWSNLSESEKQPYKFKAGLLKEKYAKEVAERKNKEKIAARKFGRVASIKVEEHGEDEDEDEADEFDEDEDDDYEVDDDNDEDYKQEEEEEDEDEYDD